MTKKWKQGDRVRLRSGGPVMLVVDSAAEDSVVYERVPLPFIKLSNGLPDQNPVTVRPIAKDSVIAAWVDDDSAICEAPFVSEGLEPA